MEIWKDIPGFEGIYQITRDGLIRNLDRSVKIYNSVHIRKGKILKVHLSNGGYYSLRLTGHSHNKIYLLHRLLAITFIPNPNGLPYINHIDGNKLNNTLSNLEWCTQSQNNKHAYDIGLKAKPFKVSFDQVCEIRALRSHLKMPNRTLAAMYGLTEDTISQFVNHRLRING